MMLLVGFQKKSVLKINFNVLSSLVTFEKKLKFPSEFYLAQIYSIAQQQRREVLLKSCLLVNTLTYIGETPIPIFHPVIRQ